MLESIRSSSPGRKRCLNDHINLYGFWMKQSSLLNAAMSGIILSVPGVRLRKTWTTRNRNLRSTTGIRH